MMSASLNNSVKNARVKFHDEWDAGHRLLGQVGTSSIDLIQSADRIGRRFLCHWLLKNIEKNISLLDQPIGPSKINLRASQRRGVSDFVSFLNQQMREGNQGWFFYPPGAGKTVFAGVLWKLAEVPSLVLVSRRPHVSQWASELKTLHGLQDEQICTIDDALDSAKLLDAAERPDKLYIMTYGAHLYHYQNSPSYQKWYADRKLVICDESHQALGKRTQEALFDRNIGTLVQKVYKQIATGSFVDLGYGATHPHLVLGLSGTGQLTKKSVSDYFGSPISRDSYHDLVLQGTLVKFCVSHVPIEVEDKVKLSELRRKVFEGLLIDFVDYLDRSRRLEPTGLKTLALCRTYQDCDLLAEIAAGSNLRLRTSIVNGREATTPTKAKKILAKAQQALQDDEIDLIISTTSYLGTGWNFPPVNAVIRADFSSSPANIVQGACRGSRVLTGQPDLKHRNLIFEPAFYRSKDGKQDSRFPLSLRDAFEQNGERDLGFIG